MDRARVYNTTSAAHGNGTFGAANQIPSSRTPLEKRLRNIFEKQGKVIIMFIAKKRSVKGRKFGFVRYGDIRDGKRNVEKLNTLFAAELELNMY
ncbi:hypothetical protein Golob_026706 [Gossypium lobatum]|uniref:RRM domain-containing protein n=1 Tax=Gossypium lobatum TaxID=34289 RepID=A0A7J8LW56_9ROSI|nr:hypothetical protein [Gossypium lobatum]